ncbi:unnamed protein product [Cyprideis torosa]|uniref:Enoyl-CoA hydratase n=1 Tax=Cyprideis torosa TaxID=163714 RepID=A0A7R8WRW6_9CRUS|nr:unnamed protein product [Cyprideis torosa]CAG0904253.1 unnamed protein product [Cyprideis torosa]
MDAVEKSIQFMEDSPLFNAGKGAVFTHEGRNEMDASFMYGKDQNAGAVGGVTNIKHPISAARAVLEKSEHVMMAGKGAEQFAEMQGLEIVDPSYFKTERRWNSLQRILKSETDKIELSEDDDKDKKHGTVGPKALNAINAGVMQGLNDWFSSGYKEVSNLKGVIITGSGEKAFVAGADIKGFTTLNVAEAQQMSKFGQDTYFLIENFHVPVLAAVNGYALGGGCELAMACHMRVASENALFGQPEVNLGLIPGYGGTQRLPQLIGKAKAMELTLTGDTIGAVEALQLGLVPHAQQP